MRVGAGKLGIFKPGSGTPSVEGSVAELLHAAIRPFLLARGGGHQV